MMADKTLKSVRKVFLNYFSNKNHKVVESSNLVPDNDPTLMFTNSGMVQFKNVFTGLEKKTYKTATTSQKCVRAGGKHNDLENVGYTPRHHTFFEMLGNFSFGDYFKEKAIYLAWELLTKDFGIHKDKLLVTVFSEDRDSFDFWKKIAGLSENKILYGHVFRNAMLIVIAGFPSAFIGILFSSSLFIEVIFSLDGLGLLGYEAALTRDYPVIFATLYFFSLLGLIMGILGDIMYSIIDPRIDFESRGN